ncbi:hypothetical protein HYH02_000417 [Chlamydomonas schloesseri]|uniref:Uncharacterized protein n=1 Tax=Chlamydomonas schloesseri TaxID=2026947 RepID=A0A835WUL5_9CHLO|nr:hypothetical protein HYH02_000417 [Chlamydomonas schloesseri]|eukprot:KAG2454574.1 hypothetical protein HYH02_000417 [Chlamydomonas schloesseri]
MMANTWGFNCGTHGSGGACNCALVSTGTEQSPDELEFARSACAAAQSGDVEKLRRILSRNAGAVNDCAGGTYTPLHYAARAGKLEAVSLLLKSGADVNAQTRGMGATALHRAAAQGHMGVVEALLKAGAHAALADCDQENALHKAAAQGHVEVCRALLQSSPAAALALDKAGRSPAERASGAALVELLVKAREAAAAAATEAGAEPAHDGPS